MKRLLSALLLTSLLSFSLPSVAAVTVVTGKPVASAQQPVVTNLKDSKGQVKTVRIFENKAVIAEGNVIKVAFAQDFTTKDVKVGDKVNFVLQESLKTKDGLLLLPAGTQIIATVQELEPTKSFNRNAKLLLSMGELVLPNGQTGTISARVNKKDGVLKRSGWNVFAKISEWTAGLLGVGAGLGAAIGAAASAAGVACLAIGLPIGAGVGLIVGVVTPGINYTVKAGKEIPIVLAEDLDIILKESL